MRIPDAHRLGAVGEGWKVAQTTLMNERVAIGGGASPREGGMIGVLAQPGASTPEAAHPGAARPAADAVGGGRGRPADRETAVASSSPPASPAPRARRRSSPSPGSTRQISGLELELLGEDGLRYDDWTMRRPDTVDFVGRAAGYRYLRAKGNSIEGGTSEILRNIIAERVLGLPGEIRVDKDVAWKDLPR